LNARLKALIAVEVVVVDRWGAAKAGARAFARIACELVTVEPTDAGRVAVEVKVIAGKIDSIVCVILTIDAAL